MAQPVASPFLGFHTLPGAPAAAVSRAATGARWCKCCDSGQIARVQSLGSKCYYRPFLAGADDGDTGDGAAWAGQVWADLRANGSPQPEAIVMRNECGATAQTGAQYLRFRAALRGFGYRGIVVLGSFAVGTPDWPEWADLKAGLAGATPDAVDLHEYWDLSIAGSAPWWALRHVESIKRGLLPADWLIFVGECGSDAIQKESVRGIVLVPVEDPEGRRGWQDRGKLTADQQSANLAAYLAGCAPSVAACFSFADGTDDPHWTSFHTFDTPVESAIRATWPKNAPQSAQDATTAPATPKEAPMTVAIDISSLQPNTGWPQVARTHQIGFVKATEGSGYPNPSFARDWAGARAAGLVRGCYHFARPDLGNTPQAEADYFLSVVGPLEPGDLLALDLEVGDGDLSGWAQAWLERVTARVGFRPFIYSYPNFIATRGLGTAALAAYPLWYASYQADWPPVPGRWGDVALWQHSDNAVVAGVAGIVDESYSALTVDQLRALGKPAPAAPQGAPTVDEALAYYQQLGVKVAADHAVYTVALKPMYDFWAAHKDDVVDGVPVGDLIKPGPLTYPEYGTVHGNGQQAACVRLSNRVVGAYLDADGTWKPYQASLA